MADFNGACAFTVTRSMSRATITNCADVDWTFSKKTQDLIRA